MELAMGVKERTVRFNACRYMLTAATVCAVSIGPAAAQSPEAPEGACFQIIPAQPHTVPASPILFNKCSGQSWVLVRSPRRGTEGWRGGRLAYRWAPLAIQAASSPQASTRNGPRMGQSKPGEATAMATKERKCFTFDGRKFCE
jgi:hypothetical protein